MTFALDILVPFFLIAIIYVVPSRWADIAGDALVNGQIEHWSFFGMGPALAYAHGGALGTDVYAQYGQGWPITFAALCHFLPLSYANMMGIGITFGCVYAIGLYAFLRLLLRNAIGAACGAFLAVLLQLFSGNIPGYVIWYYPSSTMMRHPMDVLFFLALLMESRSNKRYWIAVAGLATGLGTYFELDTGIYLVATLYVFGLYEPCGPTGET